jgi:hypothetical protein
MDQNTGVGKPRSAKAKCVFVPLAGGLYDSDWKDYSTGIYFMGKSEVLGLILSI